MDYLFFSDKNALQVNEIQSLNGVKLKGKLSKSFLLE